MKAVIVDLWGTLGSKNASFSRALSKHFNLDLKQDNYKRFEKSMQLKRWEDIDEMAMSFLHEFNLEVSRRNIHFVVAAQKAVLQYATPFPGMRRVLSKLKGKYQLYVLSNSTIYEAKVLEKWGYSDLFDDLFFSFDTKTLKPYKQSYAQLLSKTRVRPEECFYIDDNEHNCQAARDLGMKVHQFTTIAQLEMELRRRHLF